MRKLSTCTVILAVVCVGLIRTRAQGRGQAQGPQGDVPFKIVKLDPALDTIISPDARLETLGDKFGLAEGPVWIPAQNGQEGYLLFSDIAANLIYRWSADRGLSVFLEKAGYTGKDTLNVGQQTTTGGRIAILLIGPNALTLDPQQRLVICAMTDRNIVRLEKDGRRTVLADRFDLRSPVSATCGQHGRGRARNRGRRSDDCVLRERDDRPRSAHRRAILSGASHEAVVPGRVQRAVFDLRDESESGHLRLHP